RRPSASRRCSGSGPGPSVPVLPKAGICRDGRSAGCKRAGTARHLHVQETVTFISHAHMNKTYPYTIDNGHGELLTFTGLTPGPHGVRLEIAGVAQPGAGPPMHVHYLQEEAARVERGRLGYQVFGGEERFAGPGEVVVWSAGTPHKWWNAGKEELHTT